MKTQKPLKPKNRIPSRKLAIHKKEGKIAKKINPIFYRFIESKLFVIFKNRILPNIGKFFYRLSTTLLGALAIFLSLTLFDIVAFTLNKFIGSLALYFLVEEIRAHHLLINNKRKK